jgi:Domain of unknown function (DUF4145)
MSNAFLWTCPFCNRGATITASNFSSNDFVFNDNNKEGYLILRTSATTCPNRYCREYELKATLFKRDAQTGQPVGDVLLSWQLRPASSAKIFPDYVPKPITDDYTEACVIRDLSPKASATLSRRCLQGIIRDYWGISKSRLVDEISELKSTIDPATWQAIDAVRNIGNIGAHMERDINLVIDVEPQEAQLLIGLIEILIKDWYVARHERQIHLAGIVALAQSRKPPAAAKGV